ncbi:UBR-type domain-containing protein [Entamoeba marina]
METLDSFEQRIQLLLRYQQCVSSTIPNSQPSPPQSKIKKSAILLIFVVTLTSNYLRNSLSIAQEPEQKNLFKDDDLEKIDNGLNMLQLDKLLFYHKYYEITPESVGRCCKSRRCYIVIQPGDHCVQCLTCSASDMQPFLMCKKCAESHPKEHFMVTQHSQQIELCCCGNHLFETSGKMSYCGAHTCLNNVQNKKEQQKTMKYCKTCDPEMNFMLCKYCCESHKQRGHTLVWIPTTNLNEKQQKYNGLCWQGKDFFKEMLWLIKNNERNALQSLGLPNELKCALRVQLLADQVLIKFIKEVCNRIMSHDSSFLQSERVFLTSVIQWLCKIVQIEFIKKILQSIMLQEINIPQCRKKLIIFRNGDNTDTVLIHEVLLNLCSTCSFLSERCSIFLFHLLDAEFHHNPIISMHYKLFSSTPPFHATFLSRLVASHTSKFEFNEIILYVFELLLNFVNFDVGGWTVRNYVSWLIGDEKNLMIIVTNENIFIKFIEFCVNITFRLHGKQMCNEPYPHHIKFLDTFFIAVLTNISISNRMHRKILKTLGNVLIENVIQINNQLKRYIFTPQHNRHSIPTQYYLFNIFGYISEKVIHFNKETPFEFFNISQQFIPHFLEFSYYIYTAIRGSVYSIDLFTIKTSIKKFYLVEDFFGEIHFPLLYDTLLFIPQVCLLSMSETRFINTLRSCCRCNEIDDNPVNSDIALLDFINFTSTFSRFGGVDQEATYQHYLRYYQTNIEICMKTSLMSTDVLEYISYTLQQYKTKYSIKTISATHASDGVTSLTNSASTRSMVDPFRSEQFGMYSVETIRSKRDDINKSLYNEFTLNDKVKLKLSMFSINPIPVSRLTVNRHESKPNHSKQISLNLKDSKDLKELQDSLFDKLRAEQRLMSSNDQTPFPDNLLGDLYKTQSLDDKKTELSPEQFNEPQQFQDFFFPHLNSSYENYFRSEYFENELITPLFNKNFSAFIHFTDPYPMLGYHNMHIRNKLSKLIEQQDLYLFLFSSTKIVTKTNYLIILRYLWTCAAYHGFIYLTSRPKLLNFLFVCYAYLYIDVMLFIPEEISSHLMTLLLDLALRLDISCFNHFLYIILFHPSSSKLIWSETSKKRHKDQSFLLTALCKNYDKKVDISYRVKEYLKKLK